MNDIINYKLIGIGEFSHGIINSWQFRFSLLKLAIKHTDKKIVVFNEMSVWQAQNIMNNTIWSRAENKFVKYHGIKIEEPVENENYVGGKLWQYMGHSLESSIFLKIIKYIRKNRDRITLIGIDNDKIDRDYNMYKIIMKFYKANNINFLWAHNNHISDTQISDDNLKYIKNKKHKWWCGYYLKKKLGDDYCIIFSQAYRGVNRFNGYCDGNNCEKKTWQLKYFYNKFKYDKLKKYTNTKKKYQLLTEFNEPLISFSNSYYKRNKYGVSSYDNLTNWNYILFWNEVEKLNNDMVGLSKR